MDFVTATYRLRCAEADAPEIARQIALEQTVEVPEELLGTPEIREQFVGRVRSISAAGSAPDISHVVIDYPADVAGQHLGQLCNLLYGNISLKRSIRLVGIELPEVVRQRLPGPRYGIAGLRKWLGVYGRPLLATALKPRGSAPEHLAQLAYSFAVGGGDLVKDDHNLVDESFDQFRQRVDLCQSAVERAAAETGRLCVYAPNLSPPAEELDRYADFLVARGVRSVLLAPLLLGLDSVRRLSRRSPLFLMAHPTFSGAYLHDPDHGIEPGVMLGQLFRYAGCDATIFPNHGGRFSFTAEECQSIVQMARRSEPGLAATWPAPAGGMSFGRMAEMSAEFGVDTMFLIGGALLADSRNLAASTQRFATEIRQHFPGHVHSAPAVDNLVSACEIPAVSTAKAKVLERLAFQAGFRWDGRSATAYKMSQELPFAGVSRTELIGPHGEQTAFDVRYFEIAPGGYSSREKHVHTHVIVGLQGTGSLTIADRQIAVGPMDIAYVPPLEVHQLRNDSSEAFGFLCIVDHERDRPQSP